MERVYVASAFDGAVLAATEAIRKLPNGANKLGFKHVD